MPHWWKHSCFSAFIFCRRTTRWWIPMTNKKINCIWCIKSMIKIQSFVPITIYRYAWAKERFPSPLSLLLLDLPLRDQNSNAFARCVLLSFISLLVCVCMRIVSSRVLLCVSSSVLGFYSYSLSLCWTNKKLHSRFCASWKTIAFLVCVTLSLLLSTRRSSNFTFLSILMFLFSIHWAKPSSIFIYCHGCISFVCLAIEDVRSVRVEEIRKNWSHRLPFNQQ